MEENEKYIVYGTNEKGNGEVIVIGEYDYLDQIQIQSWMYAKDMQFTIDIEKRSSNSHKD